MPSLALVADQPATHWRTGRTTTPAGALLLVSPGRLASDQSLVILGRDGMPVAIENPDKGVIPITTLELRPDWTLDGEEIDATAMRSRAIGALGATAWQRVRAMKVGIIGLGGLGAVLAIALAQEGVSSLVLADPDAYELTDLSRAPLPISLEDVGVEKALAVSEAVRVINPECLVEPLVARFESWRCSHAFADCHIILVCPDSASTRRAASHFCARYLVPAISIGTGVFSGEDEVPAIGFEGAVFIPPGRCLACEMALSRRVAQDADAQREFGRGRAGSLRSINLMAVGWALRAIEEIASMRLLQSTHHEVIYVDGELRQAAAEERWSLDCSCHLMGIGDAGL